MFSFFGRKKLCSAAFSDIGIMRSRNEDSLLDAPELGIFAVADGMGGCDAGDLASRMAVGSLKKAVAGGVAMQDPGTFLRETFTRINEEMIRYAEEENLGSIGTTLSCLYVHPQKPEKICIAHVGDSRVYRIRCGGIESLTKDHTAAVRGKQDALTNSLGCRDPFFVEIFEDAVQKGDIFLLCTDGLYKQVPQSEILDLLKDGEKGKDHSALLKMAETAQNAGGIDNLTAVIVRFP